MSNINCSACNELRTEAPTFVTSGVTSGVCSSLKNDTGLSATNGHNNETDMTDAIDCLVGRMDDELEAYDACDWKDFMHKWIPNNHETLKAMLCSDSGQWSNIHDIWEQLNSICPSIDNIFSLIRGSKPTPHDGYFLQSFLDKVTGYYIPSDETSQSFDDVVPTVENWVPTFRADILEGAGCDASKRLGRYFVDSRRLVSHSPYIWAWSVHTLIDEDEVIGVVPMSAVVGTGDMSETRWKNMLRSNAMYEWGMIGESQVHVHAAGNVIIDGVEFNPGLAPYGENNLVIRWGPIIGGNRTGGFNGDITARIRSYDA